MKKSIPTFIFLFCIVLSSYSQEPTKEDWKYKPVNLKDAIQHLNKLTDDSTKIWIRSLEEDEYVGRVHFSQGMWIRNNWHLWKGGELAKYFNSIGIGHPDDMSGIIFTCFYRELKGLPWNVEEQVSNYQNYWEEQAKHLHKMETDTVYVRQIIEKQEQRRKQYYEEKKSSLPIGTEVYVWAPRRCGAFGVYKAKVFGSVVEHQNNEVRVSISTFDNPKHKKGVERCCQIEDNMLWIPMDDVVRITDTTN